MRQVVSCRHIPAEERMLIVPLVIDFSHSLMLIALFDVSIGRFAALVDALGKLGRYLQSRLAVGRGIDPVVHKRRSQRNRPACVAGCRSKCCEITCQHRSRRYIGGQIARIRTRQRSLIPSEEEQLVPQDRPAESSTVLSSLERVAWGCKRISRVEKIIPHEIEPISMKLVGARLGDGVYGTTGF